MLAPASTPTRIIETDSREIGWPIAFASKAVYSENRPAYTTLIGVDVRANRIHAGLLLLNLAGIVLLVLILWRALWLVSISKPKANRGVFMFLTSVAFAGSSAYLAIDARDSLKVGQTIQLTHVSDVESRLPEFDDIKFNDYSTFRFAHGDWTNRLGIALYLVFVSFCWTTIGVSICSRFHSLGIISIGLLLALLIVAYHLLVDYIQISA